MKFCDMYDRTLFGGQLLTGIWKSIPLGDLCPPPHCLLLMDHDKCGPAHTKVLLII